MLRLPIEELRPGMRLGRRITTADGRVLLNDGTELKEGYITTLQRMTLPIVYITNELAPDLQPVEVVSEKARMALTASLRETLGEVGRVSSVGARNSPVVDLHRIKTGVDAVVSDVLTNRSAAFGIQDIGSTPEPLLGHSINVCILSAFLGFAAGLNVMQTNELALGALLHDLGKVVLPPQIVTKSGALTPAEMEHLRKHPTLGWELLMKQPGMNYLVAAVAMQHHERFSGGGYPRNIKGKEIHQYARICAITDCFDMVASDQSPRRGLSSQRALAKLAALTGYFDPELLELWAACVAPYPVGTMVEVTGGYTAVVVAVQRGQTDRPRVRLLKDRSGAVLNRPMEVDLAAASDMSIVRNLQDFAPDFMPNWLS